MNTIAIIAAVVIVGLIAMMIGRGDDSADQIRKRLDQYSETKSDVSAGVDPMEDEELKKSFFERVIKPMTQKFAGVMAKRSKKDSTAQLKKELAQAGNPGDLTPQEFNALKVLVMLVPAPVMFVLGMLLGAKPIIVILFSVVVFVVSFLGPRIYVQRRAKARKAQIVKTLPDCLDLLTVSVEAGLGFDQAMSKVVQKFKGALAEELGIVLQEIQMGKKRSQALKDLAAKMEVDDLSSFISALVQADALGVSVSSVLRVQSDQARMRRRQRAEELAMQAPVKMLFPMVGCIFPTIMVVLMGGAAMKFMTAFKTPGAPGNK